MQFSPVWRLSRWCLNPFEMVVACLQDVLKVAISSLLLGGGSINVLLIRLSRRRLARLDLAPLKTS